MTIEEFSSDELPPDTDIGALPNGRSVVVLSEDETICSPAPTQAANVPPRCTVLSGQRA